VLVLISPSCCLLACVVPLHVAQMALSRLPSCVYGWTDNDPGRNLAVSNATKQVTDGQKDWAGLSWARLIDADVNVELDSAVERVPAGHARSFPWQVGFSVSWVGRLASWSFAEGPRGHRVLAYRT